MAARLDACGFRVTLDLLLNGLHRERPVAALLVPEEVIARDFRTSLATLRQGFKSILRQVEPAILTTLALLDEDHPLIPVDVRRLELCDFGDAQPATQHQQEQSTVHPILYLLEEAGELLLRKSLRQWFAEP